MTFAKVSTTVAALAVATGCRQSNVPATSEVRGIITYKGQPVKNAQVTFHPEDGENSGRGVTDEQGKFVLSTYSISDGAVLGKHKVTVEVLENRNRAVPTERLRAKSPIPLKYADVNTTRLQVDVRRDPNEVELQLTD